MPRGADLLPGTLDCRILKAVSLGPLRGDGVLLRIEQISGRAFMIEPGARYPALARLARKQLLDGAWGISDNNRRANFYRLTGRRRRSNTDGWERLVRAMTTRPHGG